MDRLSPELRSLIASKFGPRDFNALLNLSATNRLWYHTVSDDLIWKRLFVQAQRGTIPVEEIEPYTPKRFFLSYARFRCIVCGMGGHFHYCEFKKCYMCSPCTTSPDTPYGYRHMYSSQAKKELNLTKDAFDNVPKEPMSMRPQNAAAFLIQKIYPDPEQYYAQRSVVKESTAARVRRRNELQSKRDEKVFELLSGAGLTRTETYWPLRQMVETFMRNGANVKKLQTLVRRERFFRHLMDRLELDGRKVISGNIAAINYCNGVADCPLQLEKELVGLNKSVYGLNK